jgi:hypothetical protein
MCMYRTVTRYQPTGKMNSSAPVGTGLDAGAGRYRSDTSRYSIYHDRHDFVFRKNRNFAHT